MDYVSHVHEKGGQVLSLFVRKPGFFFSQLRSAIPTASHPRYEEICPTDLRSYEMSCSNANSIA
jgi:hypothetical protein